MGRRRPCSSKDGLNKGTWTAGEDEILVEYIRNHGEGRWERIPKRTGLKRCGKSCRLRWLNYLRPDIKRGNITDEEEDLIIRLHKLLGNRWSLIAGRLPGRTDNEIKNYWNTILRKKLDRRTTDKDKPKGASATTPPAGANSCAAQKLLPTDTEESPEKQQAADAPADDNHLDEDYWLDALQLGGGGELEQLGIDSERTVASFYKEVLGDWTGEGNPSGGGDGCGASYDCVDYFPSWAAPFFSL